MRIFTLLGVVFLVIGVGLAAFAMLPGEGGVLDEAKTMGSGIAAITLIPMGLIFTVIGVWFGRLEGNRRKLLREGVPGQATILSISGGNMVVNNINYLIKFHLRVQVPGRPPYEVEHSQLVPIFALASFPVGGTVPVLVDRADPEQLTIDMSGEALAMRRAAAVTEAPPAPGFAQPVPNTLSSMQVAQPNTITGDPNPVRPTWPVGPSMALPSMPLSGTGMGPIGATAGFSGAIGAASMAAINDQLQRLGIHLDPSLFTQGAVTVDASTVDASPGAQAALLADGRPGVALIREARDTGIDVRGDPIVELTLDVTPPGGAAYEVRTAALVPAASRSRATPGASVPVRIDPALPTNVVVDWAH